MKLEQKEIKAIQWNLDNLASVMNGEFITENKQHALSVCYGIELALKAVGYSLERSRRDGNIAYSIKEAI